MVKEYVMILVFKITTYVWHLWQSEDFWVSSVRWEGMAVLRSNVCFNNVKQNRCLGEKTLVLTREVRRLDSRSIDCCSFFIRSAMDGLLPSCSTKP